MNAAVQSYFTERYPRRPGRRSGWPFRRGEAQRLHTVRAWLPGCTGLSLLDAGCGDGVFLEQVLSGDGRPRHVRLEDFVGEFADAAARRLAGKADRLETVVTDIQRTTDLAKYDVVLAMGVFDYASDWSTLLANLLARTSGRLIADFPKRGPLHNRARRLWLGWHGIKLGSATRAELERLLAETGASVTVAELALHWMADIRPMPERPADV